jgi:hypothetical protein
MLNTNQDDLLCLGIYFFEITFDVRNFNLIADLTTRRPLFFTPNGESIESANLPLPTPKMKSSCDDIICLNNAICVEGENAQCNCATGFYGERCENGM